MTSDRWLATVLFTDIVGSTERAAAMGDRSWQDLLERHHAEVRRQLERFGGREVQTAGDGFVAAFDRPEQAIRCAGAIREAVRGLGLEIRAGLHSGEVQALEGSLGGIAVHIGARVASLARPGEVLVSSTVHDLVAGSGVAFQDRGVHALKGVPGQWRLFAVADSAEPAGARPPRRRWPGLPLRRPAAAALVGGLVLASLVGIVWWLRHHSSALPQPTSPTAVAVLPFAVRAGPDLAYLSEGMVNLLSTKLDGAGTLRSLDPRAVLGAVRDDPGQGVADPERGRAVAERLGAGLYVLGSVVEAGGQLHLDASLYQPGGPSEIVADAAVEGESDRLFELVDELVGELLADRFRGPAERVTRIAAVTTHSLPALKAYLNGEAQLRSGRYRDALASFQSAVTQDSTFALAWYRLSVTSDWVSAPQELRRESAERAVQYAERLSEHDRLLLDAFLAFRRGSAEEAERRLRSILASYPEDVEAWYTLAEVVFHYGPPDGRSVGESREAWERVLELEPSHVLSLTHLARVAAVQGRFAELDSIVSRVAELSPGGERVPEMEALRAFARRDTAAERRVEELLERSDDIVRRLAIWEAASYARDLDGAERLARLLRDRSPAPAAQALALAIEAHLELVKGRPASARERLAEAGRLHPATGLEHQALLAAMPFLETRPESLRVLRDSLAEWDPRSVPPSEIASVWFTAHDDVHEHLQLYLLGLVSAGMGEPASAAASVSKLEGLAGSPEAKTLAHNLARGVEAEVARRGGRTADALAALEAVSPEIPYILQLSSAFYTRGRERFLRAELLAAAGRREEALRWYGSFEEHSLFDLVYLAPAMLRRGEILEEEGRPEAASAYRRVVELWKDCEPELLPLRKRAESALARLERS